MIECMGATEQGGGDCRTGSRFVHPFAGGLCPELRTALENQKKSRFYSLLEDNTAGLHWLEGERDRYTTPGSLKIED